MKLNWRTNIANWSLLDFDEVNAAKNVTDFKEFDSYCGIVAAILTVCGATDDVWGFNKRDSSFDIVDLNKSDATNACVDCDEYDEVGGYVVIDDDSDFDESDVT